MRRNKILELEAKCRRLENEYFTENEPNGGLIDQLAKNLKDSCKI